VFREWFEATARANRAEEVMVKAQEYLQQALSDNGIPGSAQERELTLEDRRLECQRRAKDSLPELRTLCDRRKDLDMERTRLRGQTDWDELFRRLGLGTSRLPRQ